MTTNWSGLWAPRRPPDRIIEDARAAFDERNRPGTRRVDLVFDSLTDAEWSPSDASRILMFSGEQLALLSDVYTALGRQRVGAVFRTPATGHPDADTPHGPRWRSPLPTTAVSFRPWC